MIPNEYLEKFMGNQANEILQGSSDLNFRGSAWVSIEENKLVKQSAVLEFLKENSWVHVESTIILSRYNELETLSVTAP